MTYKNTSGWNQKKIIKKLAFIQFSLMGIQRERYDEGRIYPSDRLRPSEQAPTQQSIKVIKRYVS